MTDRLSLRLIYECLGLLERAGQRRPVYAVLVEIA